MTDISTILTSTNYYEILELEKNCTKNSIKKAYYQKSREYHPDHCDHPEATEAFKRISQAFTCLYDDEKRDFYDVNGVDLNDNTQMHFHREKEMRERMFSAFDGEYDYDSDGEYGYDEDSSFYDDDKDLLFYLYMHYHLMKKRGRCTCQKCMMRNGPGWKRSNGNFKAKKDKRSMKEKDLERNNVKIFRNTKENYEKFDLEEFLDKENKKPQRKGKKKRKKKAKKKQKRKRGDEGNKKRKKPFKKNGNKREGSTGNFDPFSVKYRKEHSIPKNSALRKNKFFF